MRPSTFLGNVERFWGKVDRTGDCWIWTGELQNKGYGIFAFWHDGERTKMLAHRMSVLLSGGSLDSSQVVMHACDNPACVNPAHLTVGTQLENMRDAKAKGRINTDGLALGQRKDYRPRPCRDCGVIVTSGRAIRCEPCRKEAGREYRRRWEQKQGGPDVA